MLIFKGKYNEAKFMGDDLDESTIKQIYTFLNHPAFADCKIRLMIDAHAGAGACIGFTMTMNDFVIPNLVGVDIGCSVLVYNIGKHKWKEHQRRRFDDYIRDTIPAGVGKVHDFPVVSEKEINSFSPELYNKVGEICERLELNHSRVLNAIGSLGSGNHFIAVECDKKDSWLNIHSGSRWFGLMIANHHQQLARNQMKEEFKGAAAYRGLEYLTAETGAQQYLDDMQVAQEYARLSRYTMARLLLQHFSKEPEELDSIESVHNYINFEDRIIRKGAISAHKGERVIIPLNMRDGSILAVGKGNEDFNFSSPHGAGRRLSRRAAKQKISMSTYRSQMAEAGVYSSCISKKTLDEAPDAYKKSKVIIEGISDTVDIISFIKPVINFKGV